jgi:hypothetical protein
MRRRGDYCRQAHDVDHHVGVRELGRRSGHWRRREAGGYAVTRKVEAHPLRRGEEARPEAARHRRDPTRALCCRELAEQHGEVLEPRDDSGLIKLGAELAEDERRVRAHIANYGIGEPPPPPPPACCRSLCPLRSSRSPSRLRSSRGLTD